MTAYNQQFREDPFAVLLESAPAGCETWARHSFFGSDLRGEFTRHTPADAPELGSFWGGAVGFFSYDVVRHSERLPPYNDGRAEGACWGDRRMDRCITIRTSVLAGDSANVQAGAGIVAASAPESEWAETEAKARAMLTAIGRVRHI